MVEIFNGQMTSRTSPETKNIRHGEKAVSARDLGPSENRLVQGGFIYFIREPYVIGNTFKKNFD